MSTPHVGGGSPRGRRGEATRTAHRGLAHTTSTTYLTGGRTMHFHVTESTTGGEVLRQVGGGLALAYPGHRPVFGTVGGAVDAARGSAFARGGEPAELHVEVDLTIALSTGDVYARGGAVTGWVGAAAGGATWCLRACDCTDGALAQIFTAAGP